ncbi:MAG: serine/threonine protein kinase [Myxococcales bacterium]|nr:serine/threonine protein kinase [Myxococcales bacterium]
MAERQFGPYRLVRQIAVGGMAEIHLAKTKGIAGFEKYVALKMIHPNMAEDEQFIEMLVDEAKIAVQLTHGNIAQTFDLGRVGETYYITMEYVDGADLYKILRRGSEIDFEMPLDVCAFIGKEMTSALDHAHRKKDHSGKPLGIVHRDVSPQNVLISYSGEVKLVDFGIAKATMKARQTAVGVIKGKYYYMSPEQAWGDKIDHRSDIFSAGIVLYEMITGQMLYLEEDLHKLLDMARRADIAPPSTLRKGVPPQLEKIVMHALQKVPGERYQSAGDFASDLERFLHAYSPVFTAAKLSQLIKKVLGDPVQIAADEPDIDFVDDGSNATFTLDTADLVNDRSEIHDDNSVIFRLDELEKPKLAKPAARAAPARPAPAPAPAPILRPAPSARPAPAAAPRAGAIPSVVKPVVGAKPNIAHDAPGNRTRAHAPTEPPPPVVPGQAQLPPSGNLGARMSAPKPAARPAAAPVRPSQRRKPNEETREIAPAPPNPADEGSGLLVPPAPPPAPSRPGPSFVSEDDLDNIGENTVITTNPASHGGYTFDGDDGVDATMISTSAPRPDTDDTSDEEVGDDEASDHEDEEGPTVARDFTSDQPRVAKGRRAAPPAALAAKIHAPAVSELRKPRPSKRTPQGGVPVQPNVLQQIVNKQANEPMPVPRPHQEHAPQPAEQQVATGYMADASGLPMTPPTGIPAGYPSQPGYPPQYQQQPGYPPQYQQQPGYPPQGYPPGYPQQPYQAYPPGYPQQPQAYPQQPMSPQALYQFQPAPTPMTLTGQMRLFEVDEMPSQYKLGSAHRRWFTYIVAGIVAISIAAAVTFFVVRSTRETAPTVGSVFIESVPAGAEVVFDGTRMSDRTPITIKNVPVGTRHEVRVELARHKPYTDTVDVPKTGTEVPVMALLKPVTGKLVINSIPGGAEVQINGRNVGRTPTTIPDLDMPSSKTVELRLKDYQPFVQNLEWPANGQITIEAKLQR